MVAGLPVWQSTVTGNSGLGIMIGDKFVVVLLMVNEAVVGGLQRSVLVTVTAFGPAAVIGIVEEGV